MFIVTGAAGLIGSSVIWGLNRRGAGDILAVDHLGCSEKWRNLRALEYADYMEKEDFINKIGSEKYTLQRSKGLGENEPDMMNFTTMNPKTRRLIKVMPEDAEKTARMFDILLGDDLSGRKEYIIENGHLYTENLDIS